VNNFYTVIICIFYPGVNKYVRSILHLYIWEESSGGGRGLCWVLLVIIILYTVNNQNLVIFSNKRFCCTGLNGNISVGG